MLWLIGILLLFIVHVALILLLEFRNPAKAVAWMFILFLCPPLGPVLYYFMARDYRKRKKLLHRGPVPFLSLRMLLRNHLASPVRLQEMSNPDMHHQERLYQLLTHHAANPITGRNQTQVYSSGEKAFGAMLERMEQARDHIHLEFYIFRSDMIGSAFAEVMNSADIFVGVNAVDYSGYPDCRPEYIAAFERMANLATKAGVEGRKLTIHAPLQTMSKADIIRRGLELGVDYSLTSSCYDPDPHGHACGRCDACRLRLRGFAEAGATDPARYAGG